MSDIKTLTVAEVAEILKVKPDTVKNKLYSGVFPEYVYTKKTGTTLFFEDRLLNWLRED